MKILIGYDGSEGADAALNDLQRAGLPEQAEARVLSVAEAHVPSSGIDIVEAAMGALPPETDSEAMALARKAAELIRLHFPGWDVVPEVRVGSAVSELIQVADTWAPDLLVIGSHGRTALGRLLVGSVSRSVVTEAQCSVRVARGRIDPERKEIRLLLAYDNTPHSQAAVEEICARNWPAGTEVKLLTAIDPLTDASGTLIDQTMLQMRERQQEALVALVKAGLAVSTTLEFGDPDRLIIEQAETWSADTIFLGTRDRGRLGRLLLGSVAMSIISRAHCSVEVVRRAATE